MLHRTASISLLSLATMGLLSGCMVESRAGGSYYPTQTYGYGSYGTTYGYSTAYAPNTVYYNGGYYGGSYYRPGYYHPQAPFFSVQSAPMQYARPGYVQPGYVQPGYAQPGYAQPGYAQPGYAQPGYGQPYAAPARPVYAAPPSYGGAVYTAPVNRGYAVPAQGYSAPAQGYAVPAAGGGGMAPRAGIPIR